MTAMSRMMGCVQRRPQQARDVRGAALSALWFSAKKMAKRGARSCGSRGGHFRDAPFPPKPRSIDVSGPETHGLTLPIARDLSGFRGLT